jgi:hypothetical protein
MRYLAFVVCSFVLLTASLSPAASIMINEYKNSNGTVGAGTKMVTDEFIEFVLTENMTAAQLGALTFGDSNDTTSLLVGVFQFDQTTLTGVLTASGQSSFLAGTIIVVKGTGLGSQNLTYAPTLGNLGDDDAWSIELVAGQGAKDHPETVINGEINVAGGGDVIWVAQGVPTSATDTSGFIHAIGHDNKPGAIANDVIAQFGAGAILSASVGAPMTIYNTAGAVVSVNNLNVSTMASGNGGANSTFLNAVRYAAVVPEPSRACFILLAVGIMAFRRRR